MHGVVRHGGHWLRRHVRQVWQSRGGGFYGFGATLTFLYLETVSLVGDVTGMPGLQVSVGGIVGWFVQNLVMGIINAVRASIWPLTWIGRFGVGFTSAALLAGSYFAFLLVRPAVLRLLREPEEVAVTPAARGAPG